MDFIAMIQYGFRENNIFVPSQEHKTVEIDAENRDEAVKQMQNMVGSRTAQYQLEERKLVYPIMYSLFGPCQMKIPENLQEVIGHIDKCEKCRLSTLFFVEHQKSFY